MYTECFSGFGKFKDFEYHINIDKNIKHVVHDPFKFALSLWNKLEKELEEMIAQCITALVNGHSDWVSSLMLGEKPNSRLRVCLDPKTSTMPPKESSTQSYTGWHDSSLTTCMLPVLQAGCPAWILEYQIRGRINTPYDIQHSKRQVYISQNAFLV